MKTVIIIPTYNEKDNIEPIIKALQTQFKMMEHEMHVLVVDDNSPDGTADIVRGLQRWYPNLHLLMGEKAGLGVAYIRGMNHAMNELGAEVVFEMDADFSHKPEDVPRLMAEIEQGADFVIGSRYVKGGSIPESWGLHRKMNSRGGNFVARYVAGIPKVRDCTAGFRAIRCSLLRKIDFSKLRVQGYGFQVALLHAAVVQKGQVVEVPVDFVDRTHGESKLGLRDILEFVLNAWWIRYNSLKTFIKFLIVGGSGVVVNLGFFTLFLALGMNKYVASPIAIELSIISNFFLNNYWTFRWRNTRGKIYHKGIKFNAVSMVSLGVSYGTFIAMSVAFPQLPPQLSQFVGIIPATLVNYFLNSNWTFKDVGSGSAYHVGEVISSSSEFKYYETEKKQKLLILLLFFMLSLAFHAPHVIFLWSDSSHDFFIHYNWAKEFIESVKLGDIYPRWFYQGAFGLGEPVFLYYAPMYYWLSAISSIVGGGTTWTSMHIVEICSSATFGWLIFLSMSYYVRLPIALATGSLALFTPFYIMVNYKNDGFPSVIGFTFLGLLIWALLAPKHRRRYVNSWAAIAIGLTIISHTISGLIYLICFSFSRLVPLQRQAGRAWLGFLQKSISGWAATVFLGLAISSVYLLPALASMSFVNSEAWSHGAHSHLRLDAFSFPLFTANEDGSFYWWSLQWPISVMVTLTLLIPVIYIWCWRKENTPLIRSALMMMLVGLSALFFASELSYPLWTIRSPFQNIQHPVRFLSVISIVGIVLAGFSLEHALSFRRKAWVAVFTCLLFCIGAFSGASFIKATYIDGKELPNALRADSFTFDEFRYEFLKSILNKTCMPTNSDNQLCLNYRLQAGSYKGLPEYITNNRGPEWLEFAKSGLEKECEVKQLDCHELARTSEGRRWEIVAHAPTSVRLPQFDFPAWEVLIDGRTITHQTDPLTGVIMIDLPEGSHMIAVNWRRLRVEWIGLFITLLSITSITVIILNRSPRNLLKSPKQQWQ